MSIDNAIRAISYAEAPTLGTAIALIAKHRMELDAALRAAELEVRPVAAEGAAEQRALMRVAASAEAQRVVDKRA
jgi:hypothetical protein